jgi:hypothetical protein
VRFAAMVGAVDAQPFGWIDALAVSPERVVSHA